VTSRLTALVSKSVEVGSPLGHLVDVIPHDPDGRVDLGLQGSGLHSMRAIPIDAYAIRNDHHDESGNEWREQV